MGCFFFLDAFPIERFLKFPVPKKKKNHGKLCWIMWYIEIKMKFQIILQSGADVDWVIINKG